MTASRQLSMVKRSALTVFVAAGGLSPLPAAGQAEVPNFEPSLRLVAEGGMFIRASGNRYPDERLYVSVAGSAMWRYHPLASIGGAFRTGLTTRVDQSACDAGPCVIEDRDLPVGLEARFSRVATDRLQVEVGAGPLLGSSVGFGSHLALVIGETASLSVHGDLYEREWHWLLGANLHGKPGLLAIGLGLALRLFGGFGDSLN